MTAEPVDIRPRRRRNLAEDVAAHIRDAILAGRLKPGQRIDQDAIADELGVSVDVRMKTPKIRQLVKDAEEAAKAA